MRALLNCLCVIVVVVVVSCNEEASEIGSAFFEGGSLNVTEVDTITLKVSTIMFDSLATNDATRFLVGQHTDDELGVLSSASFFQAGVAYPFSLDKKFTSFTRAELRLVHDGYSYYDTLTPITFRVHRITEQLEHPADDGYVYNTSDFDYDPTPMGTITYKPRPNSGDTVRIPLSDTFGSDILRLAQSGAVEVSSAGNFLGYFLGFALIPSGEGPVVGFSTTAEARIYYMDKAQTPGVERYLEIAIGEYLHYNKTSSDRTGTVLNGITTRRDSYSSRLTGGQSYVQSGSGLAVRIAMPYLRNMLIENPGLTVLNAVLTLTPTRENDGRNVKLPAQLNMTSVNYRNDLLETFSETAMLNEDYYLGRDTRYQVDVTYFIKTQLLRQELNENALVLTTVDTVLRNAADRLYIGDQLSERPMTLKITCLTY